MPRVSPRVLVVLGALTLVLFVRPHALDARRGAPATAHLTSVPVATPLHGLTGLASELPLTFEDAGNGTFVTRARNYGARVSAHGLEIGVTHDGPTAEGEWRLVLVGTRADARPWQSART